MALISNEEEVQKASNIHMAALHCMFLSSLSRYTKGALL